jgi:broad specificity phosphatase PhoE
VPALLLVRHGQASFGAADYDVLSETGLRQAEAVAADLARRGLRLARVASGSLARQRGTAEPIAAAAGCPLEVDPRWDEYRSEDILVHHSTSPVREDRPTGSAAPEVSSAEFQRILESALLLWIEAAGDGPCAETWTAFAGRAAAAADELGTGLASGETAVVCTSGGVLAALCVALLGVPPATFVAFNRVTVNAGISRVAYGRAGATLISFNEQAHLLGPDGSLLTYR